MSTELNLEEIEARCADADVDGYLRVQLKEVNERFRPLIAEVRRLRDWQKRAAPWLHELTSSLPEDEQLEVLALLETLDGD